MVGYKVYEKERTVVCTLVERVSPTKVVKTKGMAICSPNDEFDVEIGKKLAFNRARINELARGISECCETERSLDRQVAMCHKVLDARKEAMRNRIKSLVEENRNLCGE